MNQDEAKRKILQIMIRHPVLCLDRLADYVARVYNAKAEDFILCEGCMEVGMKYNEQFCELCVDEYKRNDEWI